MCLCTPPFGLSLYECQFEEDQKIRHLMCVATTDRFELVFCLVLKTSVGTLDVVGYCDCRHVHDDVESHHEDLMKVTLSMKTMVVTVEHRGLRIVWSCFPQFVCIQGVLWSSRCRCLHLDRVVRPCTGLCCNPDCGRSHVNPFSICYSVKYSSMSDCVCPCSCVRLLVLLVFKVGLHDRSAIVFFARSPSNLLLS